MAAKTISEVQEELLCPICFEIPVNKIFMCQNGHLLCDDCCDEVNACPQCRVSLETVMVRNRTLEVLMDSIKFRCANKDNGCMEQLERREIRDHSLQCLYKEKSTKLLRLCKLIGYNDCGHVTNLLDLSTALEHYQKTHGFATCQERKFPFHLKKFQDVALLSMKSNTNTMFRPLVVSASPQTDQNALDTDISCPPSSESTDNISTTFVILCSIHGKDKNASWCCFSLSPEEPSSKVHVEFSIRSFSATFPDLTWTTPVVNLGHGVTVLPTPLIRVPLDVLGQHFVRNVDKSLLLTVEIFTPAEKKTETERIQKSEAPPIRLPMDRVVLPDTQIQNKSPRSQMSSTSSPVIFEGVKCEDCGKNPITDVRYQLPNSESNFCKSCAISGRNGHPWFVLIKTVDIGVDEVDDLWWSKLRSWCVTGYPLGEKRVVKCIDTDCRKRAVYTCLQCDDAGHSRLCEGCMEQRSRTCDHVFAMCKEL